MTHSPSPSYHIPRWSSACNSGPTTPVIETDSIIFLHAPGSYSRAFFICFFPAPRVPKRGKKQGRNGERTMSKRASSMSHLFYWLTRLFLQVRAFPTNALPDTDHKHTTTK